MWDYIAGSHSISNEQFHFNHSVVSLMKGERKEGWRGRDARQSCTS